MVKISQEGEHLIVVVGGNGIRSEQRFPTTLDNKQATELAELLLGEKKTETVIDSWMKDNAVAILDSFKTALTSGVNAEKKSHVAEAMKIFLESIKEI